MHRRRWHSWAALLLVAALVWQFTAAFVTNAQDDATPAAATPVASPAAATPVASPAPGGTPVAATGLDEPPQEFVAGRWRISLVTAKRAASLPDVELDAREQRDWLLVVADITNWSSTDGALLPREFGIRLTGVEEVKGIAPRSTRVAADELELEPTDVEVGVPLDEGQSIRMVLVFQIDADGVNPALVIDDDAIPLETALTNGVPLTDMPEFEEAEQLEAMEVDEVIDGSTLRVDGSDALTLLSFVESPALDECYGDLSQARLERLAGDEVFIESLGDITYVWSEREDSSRRLLNFEQVGSGYAAVASEVSGPFAEWMRDGAAIAEARPAGLWKNCTGPHGVAKDEGSQRTVLKVLSGDTESPYEVSFGWSPVVVTTHDGTAWAFFNATADSGDNAGRNLLYAARFDPGTGGWEPAQAMPGGNLTFGAAATTDLNGLVHVAYSSRESEEAEDFSTLLYTREDGNGGWLDPVPLAPHESAGHQILPSLTVDKDNTVHALWQDQRLFDNASRLASPANADILAGSLEEGGEWGTPVLISFHSATEGASRPHVVADGDRLIAIWSVYTSAYGLETAARIDWSTRPLNDPLAWSAPDPLTAGRGDAFGGRLVDLQADPTGGAVMVYARQGSETFLFLRRLETDSYSWGGDTLVAFGQRGQFPALTVNDQGISYVTFNSGSGAGTDVAIAAVPFQSVVVGPEIILTRDDPNTQGFSGVANDVTGKPIVLFLSERANEPPRQVIALQNPIVPVVIEEP